MNLYLKPNLVTVQNVSLGNTWSADLPIGPAYDFIDVIVTMTSASGKTLSSLADFLGQLTVNVNGKSVRTHLATELDAVQTAYGSNYAALLFNSTGTSNTLLPVISSGLPQAPQSASQTTAILRIHFQEPWRKTWAGASYRRFYTSWAKTAKSPAQVLSSFQIQGAIPSTTNNSGATSISVSLSTGTEKILGLRDAQDNPIQNMLRCDRLPVTYTASGEQNLTNLIKIDKGNVLYILEELDIFSGSTGDDVTRVQVSADGDIIRDTTATVNNDDLVRHGFTASTVWNADQFRVVFDVTDDVTSGLLLSTTNGQYVNTFSVIATLNQASGSNKVLNCLSWGWANLY